MARTTAHVLFERLADWGVDTIFGLPGDGINGFMEGLRTHRERIRFVQVRHDEAADFMACGTAKFTGRLGVCIATSGPGAIHLLNGLYDAKIDGAHVIEMALLEGPAGPRQPLPERSYEPLGQWEPAPAVHAAVFGLGVLAGAGLVWTLSSRSRP